MINNRALEVDSIIKISTDGYSWDELFWGYALQSWNIRPITKVPDSCFSLAK